jgi:hypothetical protein
MASGTFRRGLFVSSPSEAALEAAEGQQSENGRERDGADRRPALRDERLEREVLAVRRAAADHLHIDDHDEDRDQRHRDELEAEEAPCHRTDVVVGEEPEEHRRDEGDDHPVRVVPDADSAEEGLAEEADLGEVGSEEARVRREERPAGEEARTRADRHSDERIRRARVVEVARQAHERVGDERDRNRREEESERHRAADEPRRRNAVQRHRRGRRHDPDRDCKRLEEAQLTP